VDQGPLRQNVQVRQAVIRCRGPHELFEIFQRFERVIIHDFRITSKLLSPQELWLTRKLEPQVRKVALDSKRRCGETDCRATDGNADDLEREIAVSEEMVQKRRWFRRGDGSEEEMVQKRRWFRRGDGSEEEKA